MIKNRIRELRRSKGLTQVQLAKMIGVTQGGIQKMETGERTMDVEWMDKISKALNVKPYELLPLEWQPSEITPAEQEILNIIRKTKESDNEADSASATG